jgi:hypothetical protein
MKSGTVALVIKMEPKNRYSLFEVLCDDREIELLDRVFESGEQNPLQAVYEFRESSNREEEEFGDYVEDLLTQPFLKAEVREHGLQWLRSKIRIEQFRQNETQASKVIAEYAFKLFLEDSSRLDFFLAGSQSQVRVRLFLIRSEEIHPQPSVKDAA